MKNNTSGTLKVKIIGYIIAIDVLIQILKIM